MKSKVRYLLEVIHSNGFRLGNQLYRCLDENWQHCAQREKPRQLPLTIEIRRALFVFDFPLIMPLAA